MNEEAVNELIEKNPSLKDSKSKLESMQPGRYCVHRSWGFGKIQDYLEAENRLIIDFESKKNHAMDPAFCATTMEVLPENHLLVRKETEKEIIEEMIKKRPADLVIEALNSFPNQAATGMDLESVLIQVVGEKSFKRWWTAARKQLAKDPRVGVPAKKSECYILRDEPIDAEHDILDQFQMTQSAKKRVRLAEELVRLGNIKDELRKDVEEIFETLATSVHDSNQLTVTERLHGAWIRNDLARLLKRDTEVQPTPGELIADKHDIEIIAESLPNHLHSRFLKVIQRTYPGEWKDIVFSLLKESHGKFTTECINFLIENDAEEEVAETLSRWLLEQNLRAPVLFWIVKNRHSRKYSKLLNGLIGPRLLNAIFYAIDYEALQTAGARKIPLAEILSDDQELIPDLIATANHETARDLANNLLLNQGFEDLTKKSLLARFIRQFPTVQSLLAGEALESKDESLIVSQPSYEQRREEYETIISKKIPENSKAIAAAREHGDLRENSEYKMAKQDQQMLLARRMQLEVDLSRAKVTDFKDAPSDKVSVGTVVSLRDPESNRTATYTILGAWDSDPENQIVSYKTPLGQSLLGRAVGDTVKIKVENNEETWTIESISRYMD